MAQSMLQYPEVREEMLGKLGIPASAVITKREIEDLQARFRKQREEYEKKHGVFMSEERKKALYR